MRHQSFQIIRTLALATSVAALCSQSWVTAQIGLQIQTPDRIVTIVPAVTEMLFAVGAGPQVVGVSNFARYPPTVQRLPRVGALLNPNIERILSLRPDFAILYGSQTDAIAQLTGAGIEVLTYRHGGITDAMEVLGELGRRTGRAFEANQIVTNIQAELLAIADHVSGQARPRVLLVVGREPDTIRNLYASGGIGFLNDMIVAAGGENVFGNILKEAVQPTAEALLALQPEVIVEIQAEGMMSVRQSPYHQNPWQALSAIPAVRTGRVHLLTGNDLIVPGPRLAAGTEKLARILHPGTFE